MTAAKLPEDVIIARIQTSSNSFDLSTPALAELSQKGVSAAVMKAMIVAPGSVQAPGQAQAPSQAGTRGGNPLQTVPSTWTDPSTGLMWTLKDYDDSVDWKVADGYCRNLGLGGFYDWRLPTIDELAGIFDTSQNVNKKHIKGGIHVEGTVWSSNKGHLLVQDFDFHSGKRDTMPPAYSLRVLCVRTAGK